MFICLYLSSLFSNSASPANRNATQDRHDRLHFDACPSPSPSHSLPCHPFVRRGGCGGNATPHTNTHFYTLSIDHPCFMAAIYSLFPSPPFTRKPFRWPLSLLNPFLLFLPSSSQTFPFQTYRVFIKYCVISKILKYIPGYGLSRFPLCVSEFT